MEITETVLVLTPQEWPAWLEANHGTRTEIRMIRFTKKSGKPSIDDEPFASRWTPRRPRGSWTETNRDRVRTLHAAGRMAPAGPAILPADPRAELGAVDA